MTETTAFGAAAPPGHADDPIEQARAALKSAGAPVDQLKAMHRAGEEVLLQTPEARRILQRVACGVIEVQLLTVLPGLHRRWPDATVALAHPKLARLLLGVGENELERAGPALGNAINSAVRETAEEIGDEFSIDDWTYVLQGVLTAPALPTSVADDVVSIVPLQVKKVAAYSDEGDTAA